jgi:hypothetical protein
MVRGLAQFPETKKQRLPIFKEPYQFSPLIGDVRVKPGSTFFFSAHAILENIYDGVHLQGRYTYTRHASDRWNDSRSDKTIPSYLSRTSTNDISDTAIAENISGKEYLSKYRTHYITMQLTYNSRCANREWAFSPDFFVAFDFPWSGRGAARMEKLTIGAELHF